MSGRRAPAVADYALLSTLGAIWGGSFMLIKLAGEDFPPATMTALRLAIAALILFAIAAFYGEKIRLRFRTAGLFALVGLFGNALPFTLIAWGEKTVDASLAAVLMGIMPIATLLLAHFLTEDEALTGRKLAGVAIGFAGLVVLVGPAVLLRLGDDGISQLAILAAAVSYAINAVLTKRVLGLPRRAAAAWLLFISTVMMLPVALLEQPWSITPHAIPSLAVLFLGIFPTGLAILVMFEIVNRQGAAFFGQVNLLVPPFGVAWAAIVLSERPEASAYVALAFILGGIWVSSGRQGGLARIRTTGLNSGGDRNGHAATDIERKTVS